MNTRSLARMLPVALLGLAMVTFTVWGVAGCQSAGGTDGNTNANTSTNENTNSVANENTNTPAPDGAALYASSCQTCHGADGGNVVGASAADITDAIDTVGVMQNITLTEEEIAAVADFLQ